MSYWKEKLLSRKFLAAAVTAVICILTALFEADLSAETVEALRCASATAIAYIFGEGLVDAVSAKG